MKNKILIINEQSVTLNIEEMNYDANNNTYSLSEKDLAGNKTEILLKPDVDLSEDRYNFYLDDYFKTNNLNPEDFKDLATKEISESTGKELLDYVSWKDIARAKTNQFVADITVNGNFQTSEDVLTYKIIDFDKTFIKNGKETTLENELSLNGRAEDILSTLIGIVTNGQISTLDELDTFLTNKCLSYDSEGNLVKDNDSIKALENVFYEIRKNMEEIDKAGYKGNSDEKANAILYKIMEHGGSDGKRVGGISAELAVANKLLNDDKLTYKSAKAESIQDFETNGEVLNYYNQNMRAKIEKNVAENEIDYKYSLVKTPIIISNIKASVGTTISTGIMLGVVGLATSFLAPAYASIAVGVGVAIGAINLVGLVGRFLFNPEKLKIRKQVMAEKKAEFNALQKDYNNFIKDGNLKDLYKSINHLDKDILGNKVEKSDIDKTKTSIDDRLCNLTNSKDVSTALNRLEALASNNNSKTFENIKDAYEKMEKDYNNKFGVDNLEQALETSKNELNENSEKDEDVISEDKESEQTPENEEKPDDTSKEDAEKPSNENKDSSKDTEKKIEPANDKSETPIESNKDNASEKNTSNDNSKETKDFDKTVNGILSNYQRGNDSKGFNEYLGLTTNNAVKNADAKAIERFINAYNESKSHEKFNPTNDTKLNFRNYATVIDINSPDGTRSAEIIANNIDRTSFVFSDSKAIETRGIPNAKDNFYTNGTVENASIYCKKNNIEPSADILMGIRAIDVFAERNLDDFKDSLIDKNGDVNKEALSKIKDGLTEPQKYDLIDLLDNLKNIETIPDELINDFENTIRDDNSIETNKDNIENSVDDFDNSNNIDNVPDSASILNENEIDTSNNEHEVPPLEEGNMDEIFGSDNGTGETQANPNDYDTYDNDDVDF